MSHERADILCLEGTFLTLKEADILSCFHVIFPKQLFQEISTEFNRKHFAFQLRKHRENSSRPVCLSVKVWTGDTTPRKRTVSWESEPILSSNYWETKPPRPSPSAAPRRAAVARTVPPWLRGSRTAAVVPAADRLCLWVCATRDRSSGMWILDGFPWTGRLLLNSQANRRSGISKRHHARRKRALTPGRDDRVLVQRPVRTAHFTSASSFWVIGATRYNTPSRMNQIHTISVRPSPLRTIFIWSEARMQDKVGNLVPRIPEETWFPVTELSLPKFLLLLKVHRKPHKGLNHLGQHSYPFTWDTIPIKYYLLLPKEPVTLPFAHVLGFCDIAS